MYKLIIDWQEIPGMGLAQTTNAWWLDHKFSKAQIHIPDPNM